MTLLLLSVCFFSTNTVAAHFNYHLLGKYQEKGMEKTFSLRWKGTNPDFLIGEFTDEDGQTYSATGKTYENVRVLHFDIKDANYEVIIPVIKGAQKTHIPVTLKLVEDEKRFLVDRFMARFRGEPAY